MHNVRVIKYEIEYHSSEGGPKDYLRRHSLQLLLQSRHQQDLALEDDQQVPELRTSC